VLPKDQADRVGEAIVEQARLATLSRRRQSHVRIPLLCRCPELGSLPRPLQEELVGQATHEIGRSWSFILAALVWVGVWMYELWTLTMSGHRMSGLVLLFVMVNWAVLQLLRGLFLRFRVRAMAAQLQGKLPIANSSGD
jgi:hypothetical protein